MKVNSNRYEHNIHRLDISFKKLQIKVLTIIIVSKLQIYIHL